MGISKKEQIFQFINNSDIELFPKQISVKTGLNHSTVKNYCRDLLEEGRIIQPYIGTYASNITYGMMIAPVRVHNVILNVKAPFLQYSRDHSESIGGVKVRVQFGLQRKKITIRLSSSKGMSRDAFLLALNRSYTIIEREYGLWDDEVVLRTFELNRDIAGVRIDGLTCYTRKSFEGFLDRIYQKDGSVRSEVKVSGEMTIPQLENILRGGIPTSQGIQGIFMLAAEMKKIFRVMQHTQEQISLLYKLFMESEKRRNTPFKRSKPK